MSRFYSDQSSFALPIEVRSLLLSRKKDCPVSPLFPCTMLLKFPRFAPCFPSNFLLAFSRFLVSICSVFSTITRCIDVGFSCNTSCFLIIHHSSSNEALTGKLVIARVDPTLSTYTIAFRGGITQLRNTHS